MSGHRTHTHTQPADSDFNIQAESSSEAASMLRHRAAQKGQTGL